MCFCAAATVARVVKWHDFPRLDREAYAVPVAYDFRLQAHRSDLENSNCPSCHQQVPQSLELQTPGVYFCLQCTSDVCGEKQGHLFWNNSDHDGTIDPFGYDNLLRLARKGLRDPRILCRRGQGLEITRDGVGDSYTLRFSLGVLIDIMHDSFEDESVFVSSHTCRH